MSEKFKFFSHQECEYFPCHNVADPDNFNCLFCYCPLFALGEKCGGNFKYTETGVKDCSECMVPHDKNAFDHVMAHWDGIAELANKRTE